MRDLQPGKLKNKMTVKARVTSNNYCEVCLNDIAEYGEKCDIRWEIELNGSFSVGLAAFHFHTTNGCPHAGPQKGKRQLQSAYVGTTPPENVSTVIKNLSQYPNSTSSATTAKNTIRPSDEI